MLTEIYFPLLLSVKPAIKKSIIPPLLHLFSFPRGRYISLLEQTYFHHELKDLGITYNASNTHLCIYLWWSELASPRCIACDGCKQDMAEHCISSLYVMSGSSWWSDRWHFPSTAAKKNIRERSVFINHFSRTSSLIWFIFVHSELNMTVTLDKLPDWCLLTH